MGTLRGIRTAIPRLAKSQGLIRRTAPAGRALKLVVDHASTGDTGVARELAGQGYHPLVEAWSTSVTGPRIFLPRKPDQAGQHLLFDYFHGALRGQGGVQNLQNYLSPIPFLETRGFPLTRRAMTEALCLFAAAENFEADALVTSGDLLLLRGVPEARLHNVSVLTPDEALALIGLKLRAADQVAIHYPSGGRLGIGTSECYDILVRDGMPAVNSWYAHCVYAKMARLSQLASSAIIRLRHTLIARDHVQQHMQFWEQPNFSEVLYHLDMLLLSFGGAFDSASHVTNAAFALTATPAHIGWRRESWLRALGAKSPSLASLVAQGSQGRAILDCLGELRNLIHSEVMGSWVFHEPEGTRRSFEVPDRIQSIGKNARPIRDVVWDAAEIAGGAWRWGLERAGPGNVLLDPDAFIEQLVVLGVDLLDELLAGTPLDHIADEPLPPQAIPKPHSGRYRDEVHRTLGYLGGLAWPENEPQEP